MQEGELCNRSNRSGLRSRFINWNAGAVFMHAARLAIMSGTSRILSNSQAATGRARPLSGGRRHLKLFKQLRDVLAIASGREPLSILLNRLGRRPALFNNSRAVDAPSLIHSSGAARPLVRPRGTRGRRTRRPRPRLWGASSRPRTPRPRRAPPAAPHLTQIGTPPTIVGLRQQLKNVRRRERVQVDATQTQ